MDEGIHWKNDRNDLHRSYFDEYRPIAGRTFERALEIGCGPFTNLRMIGSTICLKTAALLDPLIDSYLNHPGCRYTRRRLIVDEPWPGPRLSAVMIRAYRLLPKIVLSIRRLALLATDRKSIPIVQLHKCSVEDAELLPVHDLVISVNVFEHCFDAHRVLSRILSSLTADGVLVLHERLYFDEKPLEYYDPYHPLRVHGDILMKFLMENFTPLLCKTIAPDPLIGELWPQIYFIGERSSSAASVGKP